MQRSRSIPRLVPLAVAALGVPIAGCVGYRAEARTSPERVTCPTAAPREPLAFEAALALLVERNPELRALRARAAAVVLRPNEADVTGMVEVVDGEVDEALVGTDVLSLLGVGVRPARAALARAVRSEELARHHARARELARDLAEALAAERALADLAAPAAPLDLGGYERAGLVAPVDLGDAGASAGGWVAEREIAELDRRSRRRRVGELLGLAPEADVRTWLPAPDWPAVPAPEQRALLFARADLQRLSAAVAVADQEVRVAIARQYPTLGLALGARFDPTDPMQVLDVSLPLGAAAEARGALQAREAAVLDLTAGVLAAQHEAAEARLELERAQADLRFRERSWLAKRAMALAARERAAADTRELSMAVRAEAESVEAFRDLREARVARATARVRAASAAGWPGPAAVPSGGERPPQQKEVLDEHAPRRFTGAFGSG